MVGRPPTLNNLARRFLILKLLFGTNDALVAVRGSRSSFPAAGSEVEGDLRSDKQLKRVRCHRKEEHLPPVFKFKFKCKF